MFGRLLSPCYDRWSRVGVLTTQKIQAIRILVIASFTHDWSFPGGGLLLLVDNRLDHFGLDLEHGVPNKNKAALFLTCHPFRPMKRLPRQKKCCFIFIWDTMLGVQVGVAEGPAFVPESLSSGN